MMVITAKLTAMLVLPVLYSNAAALSIRMNLPKSLK